MKGLMSVPNVLTGFNLLAGVMSIVFAFSGRIEWAVFALIVGAIFDFFDGLAARLLKQQGELGKQLDSLADVITFGVAPGMIVFVLLVLSGAWTLVQEAGGSIDDFWFPGTMGASVQFWLHTYLDNLVQNGASSASVHFEGWSLLVPLVAFFIPFMSLFRLAKFNLDKRQTDNFIGLPTPANALFFASFGLLLWSGFGGESWEMDVAMNIIQPQTLVPLVLVFSFLLLAEIPLFSLKFKSVSWKDNQLRYLFLGLSVILFVILFVWSIPIIVLLYLVLSLINRSHYEKK